MSIELIKFLQKQVDSFNNKKKMKRFKVEAWFRYNDEKDFMWDYQFGETPKEAIEDFKRKYSAVYFYKIDVKEI